MALRLIFFHGLDPCRLWPAPLPYMNLDYRTIPRFPSQPTGEPMARWVVGLAPSPLVVLEPGLGWNEPKLHFRPQPPSPPRPCCLLASTNSLRPSYFPTPPLPSPRLLTLPPTLSLVREGRRREQDQQASRFYPVFPATIFSGSSLARSTRQARAAPCRTRVNRWGRSGLSFNVLSTKYRTARQLS